MREGIYTVESIEKGFVKVLYRPNEAIEEIIPVNDFPFEVREGDIVEIKSSNGNMKITYLEKETENVKAYVKSLREKLLNKSKE